MSIKPVVPFPNSALRDPTHPLEGPVTQAVIDLCVDLADTMDAATGAGLAAPQIGSPLCLFVISKLVSKTPDHVFFINPVIESVDTSNKQTQLEGCLSFPGIFLQVQRPIQVTISFTDLAGERKTISAADYYAQAILHEVDHLEGILLIDHAKQVRKELIRRKTKHFRGKYLDYRKSKPQTDSTQA